MPLDTPVGPHIGSPRSRVDGRLKVTGAATYSAEFNTSDLLHGYIVSSIVTKGRITRIDTETARAVPGVVGIFTHENRPSIPAGDEGYQDAVAPPGQPFRPLFNDRILYSGQPLALVIAEDFGTARYAASLVRVHAAAETHQTSLDLARAAAYVPPEKREGISPPPEPRGDAVAAFTAAPHRVENEY